MSRHVSRLAISIMRAVLASMIFGLAACGAGNPGAEAPPLPTIVQTTATPTPAAASTVEAEPVLPTPTLAPATATSSSPFEEQAPANPTAPPSTEAPLEAVTPPAVASSTPATPTTEVVPTTEAVPLTPTSLPAETPPAAPVASVDPPPLDSITIQLIPIAGGFSKPLFLTHAGDGSGRLFVVEQAGRILIVSNGAVNPTPFLDSITLVGSDANEQGLLSVAFHPNYTANGLFFVNYTNKQGDTVIARYQVSGNPDEADPNSAKILLTIDQPYANHNGGQVVFGPDGYLYVGMGDGGAANDPHNNGQTLSVVLGKILRLDVDNADPYGVPQNNPFVNRSDARPEIWSYGWRNPWRFSFDRATGDMYIADVGQNQYEEIHVELAGTPGGQNYGWRLMEGAHCFEPGECDPASLGLVLPIAEYDHGQGCSVTGGHVYRGAQFPALTGVYFYADYCSGIMWGLRREADGAWSQQELLQSGYTVSSFGEDEAGEVYLVHHRGDIFQVGN